MQCLLHSRRFRSLSTLLYRKDKRQSDSMDSACDMVKLPWIYRKALLILDKLEVACKLKLLRDMFYTLHTFCGSVPSICQSASL